MPSPIVAFAPVSVSAEEPRFSVLADPDPSASGREPVGELAEQELAERRMWVDGLAHFLASFSTDQE